MLHRPETLLEKWVKGYDDDPHFRAEGLATDTIEQVIDKLIEVGKNRSWLAGVLRVPRQQVSRMLNAPPNLTLLSIARLAIALGTKPRILFDSEAYYVRPLGEEGSVEEIATDIAIQQNRQPLNNAIYSANPRSIGDDSNEPT